jgi:hypothetical protein
MEYFAMNGDFFFAAVMNAAIDQREYITNPGINEKPKTYKSHKLFPENNIETNNC